MFPLQISCFMFRSCAILVFRIVIVVQIGFMALSFLLIDACWSNWLIFTFVFSFFCLSFNVRCLIFSSNVRCLVLLQRIRRWLDSATRDACFQRNQIRRSFAPTIHESKSTALKTFPRRRLINVSISIDCHFFLASWLPCFGDRLAPGQLSSFRVPRMSHLRRHVDDEVV